MGRDLLRTDLCQFAAGFGAHWRQLWSCTYFPDWSDLERGCAISCRLVAKLWRDAVLSLLAGYWRCAGVELWRGPGDISLWRGATQSRAGHLYHDALGWLDAWSSAWWRADGGLGLACGLLVQSSDRCSCAAL